MARRLKRITDTAGAVAQGGINPAGAVLDLNRLRKTFCSLENELIWQRAEREAVVLLNSVTFMYLKFYFICHATMHVVRSCKDFDLKWTLNSTLVYKILKINLKAYFVNSYKSSSTKNGVNVLPA